MGGGPERGGAKRGDGLEGVEGQRRETWLAVLKDWHIEKLKN